MTSQTTGSNADSAIVSQAEDASGNASLQFWTDTSNGMSEKLRITSDGYARLTTANAGLEWTASSGSNPFIRSIGSGQQEIIILVDQKESESKVREIWLVTMQYMVSIKYVR